MSKAKTKIGRYSKERHKKNRNQIAVIEKRTAAVPFLPKNSDAQDILIFCFKSFEDIKVKDWKSEIENFELFFSSACSVIDGGIFSKNDYMDIYEATGVELDERSAYSSFVEVTLGATYKRLLRSLRRLPGLRDLSLQDFLCITLSNKDVMNMIVVVLSKGNITSDLLEYKMDDQHVLKMPKEHMLNMSDETIVKNQALCFNKVAEANVSFEEAIFLVAVCMFSPNKNYPNLSTNHRRFTLSLVKYLEDNYGKTYHLRLQKLISIVTYFKEQCISGIKWLKENEEYLKQIYKTKLMRALIVCTEVEDAVQMLDESCLYQIDT